MATTTTNYGWDIPQSTDLVKDGATAIATLGQDIDTSIYTALGTKKAGLVLLNTTSFTAVSSQAINTVFSSAYENYRIILRINSSSTAMSHTMRMRSGVTNDTGANYYTAGAFQYVNSATLSGDNVNGGTAFPLGGGTSSATPNVASFIELSSPFLAVRTTFHKSQVAENSTAGYTSQLTGFHSLQTSYDGFEIIASTGTITGKVAVYGYNF